jgi:uncharacterized protein
MQFVLFLSIFLTFLGVGGWVSGMYLRYATPYSLSQLTTLDASSPIGLIKASLGVEGIVHFFMFTVCSLLFAYFTTPRPFAYLGLKAPKNSLHWVLSLTLILGAIPLLVAIENWISMINFGTAVKAEQKKADDLMSAMLKMPDLVSFARTFLVIAILPAVGEELLFRGILMRFAAKQSRSMLMPVLFSSLLFAGMHTNPYGLLSIFIAGILLAVIYYLTSSIWCGIIAHMFFNGSQIILSYLSGSTPDAGAQTSLPWYVIVVGGIIFGGSLYALIKTKRPLPADWADDYSPEEKAMA